MKKILIYLPAKIFTALQESLNAIPIEYDLKSFGESLPLLVLDKLRSNDVNINTSLNYQCLTIDFSSAKRCGKSLIQNTDAPRLVKDIMQAVNDKVINSGCLSDYKKQISFVILDSVTDSNSVDYHLFCAKDDENEVLYCIEKTRKGTRKVSHKYFEVFAGWPECAN